MLVNFANFSKLTNICRPCAKKHLAGAPRRAESGDLVLITRYRKPVAGPEHAFPLRGKRA